MLKFKPPHSSSHDYQKIQYERIITSQEQKERRVPCIYY